MIKRRYLFICLIAICIAIATVIILKLINQPKAAIIGGGLAGGIAGALGAYFIKKERG